MDRETSNKIYAGVLGKIIGVFYGRPVEGWPYEKIRKQFDLVDHYVYKEVGTPLIVADDDIAGTFTFLNAIEDSDEISSLTSLEFGEAWLDYVIEDKTIFWWGGLGRSTEHTAYLRLKNGIKAPLSGSIEMNGEAIAEQIGAQIFMDALAMMCPGDPVSAKNLVRASARVSHDGIAVEAACFLASMESLAFEICDINELLDKTIALGVSDLLNHIISDVREKCSQTNDFRELRNWLDKNYGYELYPGNCHIIPNFALILMSLILGGDDFARAMQICVSCGWDTDCNAANLGCLNGIRLGLDSICEKYDFRSPVKDRLYNISSNGGGCVSDAVQQARRIQKANARLYRLDPPPELPRFAFEFPGSVQGFSKSELVECDGFQSTSRDALNANTCGKGNGLLLCTEDSFCAYSTLTMYDPSDRQSNYGLTASPTLYESQTVLAELDCIMRETGAMPEVCLFVAYFDFNDKLQLIYSPYYSVKENKSICWKIPDTNGMPIAQIGILCRCRGKSEMVLRSLDWKNAPDHFEIAGSLRNYDIGKNMALDAFVTSAKQFGFDSAASFVISHTENNGVATIGAEQWENYRVISKLEPSIHKRCGLLARARGHRRYYALALWDHHFAGIICKKGSEEHCLVQVQFDYEENQKYECELRVCGSHISARVEDVQFDVIDDTYKEGGAGFLVDFGTVLAYGFLVEKISSEETGC